MHKKRKKKTRVDHWGKRFSRVSGFLYFEQDFVLISSEFLVKLSAFWSPKYYKSIAKQFWLPGCRQSRERVFCKKLILLGSQPSNNNINTNMIWIQMQCKCKNYVNTDTQLFEMASVRAFNIQCNIGSKLEHLTKNTIFQNWLKTHPKVLNAWPKCLPHHFEGVFREVIGVRF